MALSDPINEGHAGPAFSYAVNVDAYQNVGNRTDLRVAQTNRNACTACRSWVEKRGSRYDYGIWFSDATNFQRIHRWQSFSHTGASGTETPYSYGAVYGIQNPLAYHEQLPSQVLQDMVRFVGETEFGSVRLSPTADAGPNQWTPSTGSNPHYTYVDKEGFTNNFYLYVSGRNLKERFKFYNQAPTNLQKARRIVVHFWFISGGGSDLRAGLTVTLSVGATLKNALNYLSLSLPADAEQHHAELEFACRGTNYWSKSEVDQMEVELWARAPSGGSLDLYLYGIRVDVFYEPAGSLAEELVDAASFDSLDSYFSTNNYKLEGTVEGSTLKDGLLFVLRHAPELMIYEDGMGRLALAQIDDLSGQSPVLELRRDVNLASVRSVRLGRERLVGSALVQWGTWAYTSDDESTQAADRVDLVPIGSFAYRSQLAASETSADLRRPMLGGGFISDGTNATRMATVCDKVFGHVLTVAEIRATADALALENGDVVAVTEPALGWSSKLFRVARVTWIEGAAGAPAVDLVLLTAGG